MGSEWVAVPELRIKDLTPFDNHQLYQISVYKKSKFHYTTFCTPECRKVIDDYIKWRQSLGEELKPQSPLFRKSFDRDDMLQVQNNSQPLCLNSINWIVNDLLHSTGVRTRSRSRKDSSENIKKERREVMQAHGLRKFFDTTCTLNGMDGLYVEKLMGHDIGLKAHYFKPSSQELLEGNDHKLGYISIIDALTINDENRLMRENQILKVNKSEIDQLKDKAGKYESFMSALSPQIEEFQREINSLKLHLSSQVKPNDKDKEKSKEKS